MQIKRTVYNHRLRTPDSVTVRCGGKKVTFTYSERAKVGEWVKAIWNSEEDGFFNNYSPAYVYYNIDWDSDHVLYAKFERIA